MEGGLKRKDTTKGPPLRILSLDGGGVRGYSMFLIIQELMHRTFVETEGRAPRRSEIPKPCDHFDLIVGTGTGGLIAIMLGRLRLDLETCKELYVRLTRKVFETDKTIAGIPYRSTIFKATKLEEAIQDCVREHTINDREGNDGAVSDTFSPLSAVSRSSAASSYPRRHASNASVVSFSARSPSAQSAKPAFSSRWGNPHARLYDERENRTKTAVTAMYKGSPRNAKPAVLRSYDSRKEPAPEFDCTIWQAGRATCAIGLAFKPIQIGQSIFHDDGAGVFNPSMYALDEAVVNEWPGREVGVFVSVGTGKRPKGSDMNSTLWYEGFMGEFADARRKLIAKIEGCEKIHEMMKKEHLVKRGVNIENYYRFNVEVGVGEFGMNEWHRLSDISTNTRRYLQRDDEQRMVQGASAKLAKIHFAKQRWERANSNSTAPGPIPELIKTTPSISMPLAVELPGDMPIYPPQRLGTPPSRQSYESGFDALSVPGHSANGINTPSPRSSAERVHSAKSSSSHLAPSRPAPAVPPPASFGTDDSDKLVAIAPTPAQWRNASGQDKIAIVTEDDQPRHPWYPEYQNQQYQQHFQYPPRIEPPPLPPKTPLSSADGLISPISLNGRQNTLPAAYVPYPIDDDEEPPVVNMARKPNYNVR
ncbi:acyl transferase/acyl hydrolase/lysophospholipase [Neurospora hispaniola]|uniref:Acyl transferase/acyl hydrolase/lysophospholipase n=1 Tax=Neurospora hispaniola TaxID=588809 RepID=A0AAJ0IFP3_9PEZI|nr:acyl transferase/acyl hydrolase/lysophospholipase [Neurospora hispaniola]